MFVSMPVLPTRAPFVGGALAHARINPAVERFAVPTVSVGRRPSP
jgi:hypothetical protein